MLKDKTERYKRNVAPNYEIKKEDYYEKRKVRTYFRAVRVFLISFRTKRTQNAGLRYFPITPYIRDA